jgi:signal transduction histidine kinase
MTPRTVLLVDDDVGLCDNLQDILEDRDYIVYTANTCSAGLATAREKKPQAAVLDERLPDGSGVQLLADIRRDNPDCYCIMMTAYADIESVMTAIERGVFHYLLKPVGPPEIIHVLERVFRTVELMEQKKAAERALEEEQLRSEKLSAIGLLAGGIAHDFNNLVTAILGNITLAKMYVGDNEKALRRLEAAEQASLRTKDLTHQLLTFASGGAPVKQIASLGQLVRDAATFVLRGSSVKCDFSIPVDLWLAPLDQGLMTQVIYNLVINAQQAMPEGGTVTVAAENVALETASGLPLPEGAYVHLSVSDHGPGIAEGNLNRLFDPYFSTKKQGSGLGLTTAYSIVKNHGGTIAVESQPGRGSTFHVYLPASPGQILPPAPEGVQARQGKGKILVMDDEEIVRDLTGDLLETLGYEALFACDGTEAIELYTQARDAGEPFHAVILDLTIAGGLGGKATVERLRQIDPNVKAIVSSGYSNDPVMASFRDHGFTDVIAKPYGVSELSEVLYRTLHAGSPARRR